MGIIDLMNKGLRRLVRGTCPFSVFTKKKNKMTKEEIIKYWLNSADIDSKAMESLFNNGHYMWALFVGHLVIEKLLKAFYTKNVGDDIPYTHDLSHIAKKANLAISEGQEDFLDDVTTFNIKARYPDYKNRFYRKATVKFTEGYITQIKEFRLWVIEKINE